MKEMNGKNGFRGKMMKALVISGCAALFTTGAAFAENGATPEGVSRSSSSATSAAMTNGGQAAVSYMADYDDPILQKQREIDEYLFVTHAAELATQNFKVTHTAPSAGYVQIGITPYSEENAQYLIDIFGEDVIRVVAGDQAYTMVIDPLPGAIEPAPPVPEPALNIAEPSAGAAPDSAGSGTGPAATPGFVDPNTPVSAGDADATVGSGAGDISSAIAGNDGRELATTASAGGTGKAASAQMTSAADESSGTLNWIVAYAFAGAIIFMGGIAFIIRKLRSVKAE